MKEYKKNLLYLLLAGSFIGSSALGMDKITGQLKTFGQKAQTQVDHLKAQLVAQAKKALETSDPQLLQLAKNALEKAQKLVLLPQAFKKQLADLSNRITIELQRRASTATVPARPASSDKKQLVPFPHPETEHAQEVKSLTVGDKAYLPVTAIRPGQSRYAAPNVDQKVAKMQKNKGKFDAGYSALNINEKAIPVVKGPFENSPYVLIDGHHDVLAAIALESKTIPIEVKKDMSNLTPEEFYKQAANEGLIYYKDINDNLPATYPVSFDQLTNDPYRWFATVITRKCANQQVTDSTSEAEKDSYAYNYPVLAKSDVKGEDTPFIEFIVANILNKAFQAPELAQFNEEVQEKSNNPSRELVEKAREVLRKHFENRPDLPQIRLIPIATEYKQISNFCTTPDFNPKS